MIGLLWALLGCAVAATPTTDGERLSALHRLYDRYDFGFPRVEAVDAPQLEALLAGSDPPLLIDVRPANERAVSILPGAVALEDYEAGLGTTFDRGRAVVTYCTVGVRSGFAANRLRKQGLEVLNFRGSILAWTHHGGALITPEGAPTQQVHVYGKRWNYAASGYEPVIGAGDAITPVE